MGESEQNHEHREHSLEQTELALQNARPLLEARLEQLSNPFHNRKHVEEVVQRVQEFLNNLANPDILNDKQKLLLHESAFRHDDGHSGNTYRQEVVDDGLSNEEYAVALLKQDVQDTISGEDFHFMKDHILATSFGQNDLEKLPADKKRYYRPYKPETGTQKLLAFADAANYAKGWDAWLEQHWHLLEESPQNTPSTIDAWIAGEVGFVHTYLSPMLESLQQLFTPEYFRQLQHDLQIHLQKLVALKEVSNSERNKIENKLTQFRES
ncbi:MAG: hypothetical protein PHH01_04125 [Patescibacteria group bacterium]|nr:hypothetical protein [Patescibacteria group bacterium]